MIGGLKTVKLTWLNKFAVNRYSWLFVYECVRGYEEGVHVPQKTIIATLRHASHRWTSQLRLTEFPSQLAVTELPLNLSYADCLPVKRSFSYFTAVMFGVAVITVTILIVKHPLLFVQIY